jgi:hypothetical protein
VLSIESGNTSDHRLVDIDGSVSRIRIDRLSRKPEVCDRLTPNTPLGNFEVFAQTWAEHYISFELKHADWSKVVAENRAKITLTTTPSQLFDILKSMIVPFGDAHAAIIAPDLKKSYSGLRSGTGHCSRIWRMAGLKIGSLRLLDVTARISQGPVRSYCNGKISMVTWIRQPVLFGSLLSTSMQREDSRKDKRRSCGARQIFPTRPAVL